MTRLIAVASGKGGVGKTTTTCNLGVALSQLEKSVIALDANLTTPNIGLHLGMHDPLVSLNDVLEDRANIVDAIALHESGLRVVPAGLSMKHLRTLNPDRLWNIVLDLFGSADFVLLDTPAGLEKGAKSVLEAGEEVIIVTNPETPALTDALKTTRMAYRSGSNVLGCVLNRVRNEPQEISINEVESMLDIPVIGIIPEDPEVRKSIHTSSGPVVYRKPNSPAAKAYRKLAADIAGIELELAAEGRGTVNILKRLFGIAE